MTAPKQTTDALNDFLRAYNQLRDNRGITYFNGELDFELKYVWEKFVETNDIYNKEKIK